MDYMWWAWQTFKMQKRTSNITGRNNGSLLCRRPIMGIQFFYDTYVQTYIHMSQKEQT